jgi:hypothetical protein
MSAAEALLGIGKAVNNGGADPAEGTLFRRINQLRLGELARCAEKMLFQARLGGAQAARFVSRGPVLIGAGGLKPRPPLAQNAVFPCLYTVVWLVRLMGSYA